MDADGLTALHHAAANPSVDVIKFLLAQGHNPDCSTKFNVSPLHLAARFHNWEVCELLLQRGALVDRRVSAPTYDHYTPPHTPLTFAAGNFARPDYSRKDYHKCVIRGPTTVQLLLKHGADAADNSCGNTALQMVHSIVPTNVYSYVNKVNEDIKKILVQRVVEMEFLNLRVSDGDRHIDKSFRA